jgi:hypothetical protein
MDRRKANALAAFNKAVELTDRDCRNTVIKVLQAGREGMPFKYKIEGDLWAGVWGMHGTFVPPHSVHNAVEGVERHGGGSEYVVIGNDAWAKAPFHDWQKADTPSPLSGEAGAPFFDDFLIGAVSHIGRAQCPSRGQVAGDQIDYHEYDLYRDTTGGRVRAATQRMYTDPDGERPVKLETIGPQGRVVQVQTRTYVPGLVIEPPTAAAK